MVKSYFFSIKVISCIITKKCTRLINAALVWKKRPTIFSNRYGEARRFKVWKDLTFRLPPFRMKNRYAHFSNKILNDPTKTSFLFTETHCCDFLSETPCNNSKSLSEYWRPNCLHVFNRESQHKRVYLLLPLRIFIHVQHIKNLNVE